MDHLAQPFMSLVDFVREGNNLNDQATEDACTLMNRLLYSCGNSSSAELILFELVPSPDGSCSGFTESILPLLTSSNMRLVKTTLRLLERVVHSSSLDTRFSIIETGFFQRIPITFYEHDMHLVAPSTLHLMNIVVWILIASDSGKFERICRNRHISMEFVHEIYIINFFHPIESFLEFAFHNRRRVVEESGHTDFSSLLGILLQFTPFMDQMTQFMVSSSFALTYTDFLHFWESDNPTRQLLQNVVTAISAWKMEDAVVRKRGQQILIKMCEEGFEDEMELPFTFSGLTFRGSRIASVRVWVISEMGGNAPFWNEWND
ncbi:hypothetical protein BLNAU_16703 [Blattamonas nauphoetae]|uniref:Uncharacterized protein n=1 Tax=Blattamonas nauphoetae TaxID=2049346 RepID=A0ABQ9XCH8_9EUKA|nr:hypothetical protein BLNAU_16703 [Blattamonas nauphoetae]